MTYKNFAFAIDHDGIATATWDMPDNSMNVIDWSVMDELEAIIEAIAGDDAIGAIITSGKDTFSGGADLKMLQALHDPAEIDLVRKGEEAAVKRLFDKTSRLGRIYRRLETCGRPVVAALNGTAVGGAFELALACHYRVVADDDRIKLGLPEVRVGLMPGAGGTQRVPRLADPQEALRMLLQGQQLTPSQAKAMKLVDAVVPADALIAAARKWLLESPRTVQPWDEEGFTPPGGRVYSTQGAKIFPAANAIYRRETCDNYPGGRAILSAVFEGLQLPFDTALLIEARYFIHVLQTKEAAAMIRSLFISMRELNKLARRPDSIPADPIRKIAVIGAGFMGSGIAGIAARAGIEIALLDRDLPSAESGRGTVEKSYDRHVSRKRMSAAERDEAIARISPAADFSALAGADLVIEAVFEDRTTKEDIIKHAEAALPPGTIFGSNTSTLPITSLAAASARPEDFIGIHFFSPVDRMMLVEVIMGRKTGARALARALDFVRAIGKTPIVVNDSRGFYTSRVVESYIGEGHRMLIEGVAPALIENAARMAGMPVGPLSLNDEVAIDLSLKIMRATRDDLGDRAVPDEQYRLIEDMVEKHGRLGRKNGKGFYDYPDDPNAKKKLWPGLAELFPPSTTVEALEVEELKQRFLVRQALETARCFEEGVLTDVREADVGSILGFGFAPFTGGTLSYIDFMGVAEFNERAGRLARKYGPRFRPNRLLRDLAKSNQTFYGRFAAKDDRRAA